MTTKSMDFVFWQNAISMHQSTFLRSLSERYRVVLVVENELNPSRKSQGWQTPDFGKTNIITNPNNEKINILLDQTKKSWHIFSGFHAVPMIRKTLKMATKQKIKCLVMLEPFNSNGWKGKIRKVFYWILARRWRSKIIALLPTGENACKQYKSIGFPKSKIFNWGYFTETQKVKKNYHADISYRNNLPSVIFIGQLIPRKNILKLINIMLQMRGKFQIFTIVGAGKQENQIRKLIKDYNDIRATGTLPNHIIKEELLKHDLLVLPSLFDGWGAVVNEALQSGTPVLASENCGAVSLLDGKLRGEKFSFHRNNMETVLKKWLNRGKISNNHREVIKQWSKINISGEAATSYFLEIIDYVSGNSQKSPLAPWMKDSVSGNL